MPAETPEPDANHNRATGPTEHAEEFEAVDRTPLETSKQELIAAVAKATRESPGFHGDLADRLASGLAEMAEAGPRVENVRQRELRDSITRARAEYRANWEAAHADLPAVERDDAWRDAAESVMRDGLAEAERKDEDHARIETDVEYIEKLAKAIATGDAAAEAAAYAEIAKNRREIWNNDPRYTKYRAQAGPEARMTEGEFIGQAAEQANDLAQRYIGPDRVTEPAAAGTDVANNGNGENGNGNGNGDGGNGGGAGEELVPVGLFPDRVGDNSERAEALRELFRQLNADLEKRAILHLPKSRGDQERFVLNGEQLSEDQARSLPATERAKVRITTLQQVLQERIDGQVEQLANLAAGGDPAQQERLRPLINDRVSASLKEKIERKRAVLEEVDALIEQAPQIFEADDFLPMARGLVGDRRRWNDPAGADAWKGRYQAEGLDNQELRSSHADEDLLEIIAELNRWQQDRAAIAQQELGGAWVTRPAEIRGIDSAEADSREVIDGNTYTLREIDKYTREMGRQLTYGKGEITVKMPESTATGKNRKLTVAADADADALVIDKRGAVHWAFAGAGKSVIREVVDKKVTTRREYAAKDVAYVVPILHPRQSGKTLLRIQEQVSALPDMSAEAIREIVVDESTRTQLEVRGAQHDRYLEFEPVVSVIDLQAQPSERTPRFERLRRAGNFIKRRWQALRSEGLFSNDKIKKVGTGIGVVAAAGVAGWVMNKYGIVPFVPARYNGPSTAPAPLPEAEENEEELTPVIRS